MGYLPVNIAADHLHFLALDEALHGEFDEAHVLFEEALASVDDGSWEDAAATTQAARIIRDNGFTYTREAVKAFRDGEPSTAFTKAQVLIEQAITKTTPLASGAEKPIVRPEGSPASKHQRREILSEHAISVGLLGETVVAWQVALGVITPKTKASEAVRANQFQIGAGYDLAKVGTNQYYAARLARLGIRTEVLNGRRFNALPWFGRLAVSVAKATILDRSNAIQATAQFEKTRQQALTRKAAFDANRDWRQV